MWRDFSLPPLSFRYCCSPPLTSNSFALLYNCSCHNLDALVRHHTIAWRGCLEASANLGGRGGNGLNTFTNLYQYTIYHIQHVKLIPLQSHHSRSFSFACTWLLLLWSICRKISVSPRVSASESTRNKPMRRERTPRARVLYPIVVSIGDHLHPFSLYVS